MIRFVQIGFIYMAIAIAFLHTAIPHKHHSEMQKGEDTLMHENSSSLIDMLALMFHHDEGDQNLENIEASDINIEIDNSSLLFLYSYFIAPCQKVEKIDDNSFIFSLQDLNFICPVGHRGPPLV